MRLHNSLKSALLAVTFGLGLSAAALSYRPVAPSGTAVAPVAVLTPATQKTTIAPDVANPDNIGVVEIKAPELANYKRIIAVSDVHGMYYEVWHLLMASGIIEMNAVPDTRTGKPTVPLKWQPQWHGSGNLLVVAGDSIDKGPQSLEVLKLWYDLQQQTKNNNRIVVLLGNHEAEYLADPLHKKSIMVHQELIGQGCKPDDLARPAFVTADGYPLGKFMRSLPLAARIGDWLFSHAGWMPDADMIAPGQSEPAARWATFKTKAAEITRGGKYGQLVIPSGDEADVADPDTEGPFVPMLEKKVDSDGKKWWKTEIPVLEARLTAYGLYGSVFGHRPAAFELEDAVGVSSPQDYRLVKIDSGMGVPGAPKEKDEGTVTTWQPPYMGHLLLFANPLELAQQKPPTLQSVGFSKIPLVTLPSTGVK